MKLKSFTVVSKLLSCVFISAGLAMSAYAASNLDGKTSKPATCTLDGGKDYSAGAVVEKDGRWFQCTAIYANKDEKSPVQVLGYGWVEMLKGENSFSLK